MERIIKDKKELMKLASFLVMCDGGVYKRKHNRHGNFTESNAQFVMNSTSSQYISYAEAILRNITSVAITDRKDYNTDGCERLRQKRLETKRHPIFTKLHDRIYRSGYKGLDEIALKSMDSECLAMLYMADGSISFKEGSINSVTLNTKRLTRGDNEFLAKVIERRFGVVCTVNKQKQYTYLRVKGKSIYSFFEIIKPFILADFKYKVPNDELLSKYRQDDDIVCTPVKAGELGRNDLAT